MTCQDYESFCITEKWIYGLLIRNMHDELNNHRSSVATQKIKRKKGKNFTKTHFKTRDSSSLI